MRHTLGYYTTTFQGILWQNVRCPWLKVNNRCMFEAYEHSVKLLVQIFSNSDFVSKFYLNTKQWV